MKFIKRITNKFITELKNNKLGKIMILLVFIFIISTSLKIYKYDEYTNVHNLDASYHTLLTIEALKESSIGTHKFLPIITLGGEENKNIPWGATVNDSNGNYYYTSFPQLGFIIPYVVFSLFNLEINLFNLMIFNIFIHLISTILCFNFIYKVILKLPRVTNNRLILAAIGTTLYILNYEALFSHGVIYWAHSLFQVFWLAQLIFFINIIFYNKINKLNFWFLGIFSFLVSATEWTGYLSNFILLIILMFYFLKKKIKIYPLIAIISGTILAIMFYFISFALVIGKENLFHALFSRFSARNYSNEASWSQLINGYIDSYGILFVLILGLIMICLFNIKNLCKLKKAFYSISLIFLITLFPMLENLIMKQHAISYTFDRLKIIVPIIVIVVILLSIFNKKQLFIATIMIVIALTFTSLKFIDSDRIWDISLVKTNEPMIEDILDMDGVMYASSELIRGYANLEFQRGIYENIRTENQLFQISSSKIIWLLGEQIPHPEFKYPMNEIYNWRNIIIFDKKNSEIEIRGKLINDELKNMGIIIHPLAKAYFENYQFHKIRVGEEEIAVQLSDEFDILEINSDVNISAKIPYYKVKYNLKEAFLSAENLTDVNWDNGVSRDSNIILIRNKPAITEVLAESSDIIIRDTEIKIMNVDIIDENWIHVYVETDEMSIFKYPAQFKVK